MTARTSRKTLRRRQIDRALAEPDALRRLPTPRTGWIRETREALGMTETQLAVRLGVTQPAVADLERRETDGGLTLGRLRQAAAALGCRLTYALVPPESLDALVRTRARHIARQIVARVAHTMALEDQAGTDATREEQIADLAEELVRTLGRELWQDPALDAAPDETAHVPR